MRWLGSLHIPLEHLPHALQCSPEQFETDHSGPQPAHGHGWVVLCSRRERRAAWAAQVAADVGFNCLILRQVYDVCVCPLRGCGASRLLLGRRLLDLDALQAKISQSAVECYPWCITTNLDMFFYCMMSCTLLH